MEVNIEKSVDKEGNLIDAVITIRKDFGEIKITSSEFRWLENKVGNELKNTE
jgi:hypothetical protein